MKITSYDVTGIPLRIERVLLSSFVLDFLLLEKETNNIMSILIPRLYTASFSDILLSKEICTITINEYYLNGISRYKLVSISPVVGVK